MYRHVQSSDDLPKMLLAQITQLFEHDKDLEEGKWVKIDGWSGTEAARQEIIDSIEHCNKAAEKPYF